MLLHLYNREQPPTEAQKFQKKPSWPLSERSREGVNMDKLLHGLGLPFRPRLTKTLLRLDRFEDMDVEWICRQISGLILDVDGTLVEHHSLEPSEAVIAKLEELTKSRIALCIFSNNIEERPIFKKLGIPTARHLPPKPDPRAFVVLPQLYLKRLPASRCAMTGDNYLTDGGCRNAGMHFIHVNPIPGPEGFFHRLSRSYGIKVARLHDRLLGRNEYNIKNCLSVL